MTERENELENIDVKVLLADVIKQFEENEEEDTINEIPTSLLRNLITWLRNKGISEENIIDCLLFITAE